MADERDKGTRGGGWVFIGNGVVVFLLGSLLMMKAATVNEHTMTRTDAGYELAAIETVFGFEVGRSRRGSATMVPSAKCEYTGRGMQSCAVLLEGGEGKSGRYPMSTEAEANRVADELRALQPGGTVRWDESGVVTRDHTRSLVSTSMLEAVTGTGFFVALGMLLFGAGVAVRRHRPGGSIRRSPWLLVPLVLVGVVLTTHLVLRAVT